MGWSTQLLPHYRGHPDGEQLDRMRHLRMLTKAVSGRTAWSDAPFRQFRCVVRMPRYAPFGTPERLSGRWGKRRPSLPWRKVPNGLSVSPIVYKGAVGPGTRQLGPDSFA